MKQNLSNTLNTGDLDDLVSIDQSSVTSRILDRNHSSVASRILDRNYSASSNDTKTMTPGSFVGSPVVKSKSNLTTQDISRLCFDYEQKDKEKKEMEEARRASEQEDLSREFLVPGMVASNIKFKKEININMSCKCGK